MGKGDNEHTSLHPDGAWTISDVKAAQPQGPGHPARDRRLASKQGLGTGQDFAEGVEDSEAMRPMEGSAFRWNGEARTRPAWSYSGGSLLDEAGKDGQAAWIHSLAVRRIFTGRGLGKAPPGLHGKPGPGETQGLLPLGSRRHQYPAEGLFQETRIPRTRHPTHQRKNHAPAGEKFALSYTRSSPSFTSAADVPFDDPGVYLSTT